MKKFSIVPLLLLIVSASTSATFAQRAKHDWGSNPLREGWDLIDESKGAHIFHGWKDGFSPGMSTWYIDTLTNGADGVGAYEKQFGRMAHYFGLTAIVRLGDISASGGQAIRLISDDPYPGGGLRAYGFLFSRATDGDPIVSFEGSTFSMEIDGGAGEYQTYRLFVDQRRGISRVNISGVGSFHYEGFGHDPNGGPAIQWGDLFDAGSINGRASYAQVLFRDFLPEPAGIPLVMVGFASLFSVCRVRRR